MGLGLICVVKMLLQNGGTGLDVLCFTFLKSTREILEMQGAARLVF